MDFGHVTLQSGVEIITEARYAIVAVYCLQLYEWIATAKKEIDLVHRSRWSSVKVAYLLCRYYTLLIWPLVMFAYVGNHTWDVCRRITAPVHILLAPSQLFPQAVMLMRAYAFCGRDKRVLMLLLTCYGGLVAIVIWAFCTHIVALPEVVFLILEGTGCYPYYSKGHMGFRIGWAMLAATLMDLASLICICVYCACNRSRQISLAMYFIRQGMISFAFVVAVNVAAAVVFLDQSSPHNGLGLPFTIVISNLIACRIILGLRRKVRPTDSEIAVQHSQIIREGLRLRSYDEAQDGWLMEEYDPEHCI